MAFGITSLEILANIKKRQGKNLDKQITKE
jgi:hypothetical protein